jgi:two-component system response regulator AtoC
MSRILIIDDDEPLCRSLQIQLIELGHEVRYANRGAEGVEQAAGYKPDLVLLDLALPDGTGLQFLPRITGDSTVPVAMITGRQDMKATIEAMRLGAFDYLRKPFELDDVSLLLEKAQRANVDRRTSSPDLRAELASPGRHEIVGSDPKITELIKQIGLLSRSRVTVLIEGESGTGKELVARALHGAAAPEDPFVPINCSALVPTLLESELFGHERGAFTGADARKTGKMELAGKGTLFLDEIGDMSLELQAKLLRVLQEREFERVGGVGSVPFQARVIAATNRDLRDLVKQKTFREDLLFRLAVSSLVVPPLRERRGDIRPLVRHLLGRITKELHRDVEGVDESAMRRLETYDWPGNVRELENVLTRAVALSQHPILTAEAFGVSLNPSPVDQGTETIVPLKDAEKRHIEKALICNAWNITRTARVLQISPTTLRKKISDNKIKP